MRKFSEYFAGMEGSYVLIGGAASHILEEEAQLVPRATKDLDIILIVEALSDEFVSKFWSFVKNAGYEHIQFQRCAYSCSLNAPHSRAAHVSHST